MVDLSKKQYKMLCRIKKQGNISLTSLTEDEKSVCLYLLDQKCIVSPKRLPAPWQSSNTPTSPSLPSVIRITQTGEAQIYTFRSKFYKWWIPVVISIIALITSVAVPVAQLLLQ